MRRLVRHRVENAAIGLRTRQARGRIGALTVAEEPLEDRARIVLHRQRRRRRAPGDRRDVGATEPGVAGAGELGRLQAELERRELRVPAEVGRRNLVDGDPRLEVGALGRLHVDAGQERAADASMAARRLARAPNPRLVVEAAQHQHAITVRRERGQDRAEREVGSDGGGRPVLHHGAVPRVEDAQAPDGAGRRVADGGERRHHAVEQRQRDAGAETAQDGPARERLPGDDHGSGLLIVNGTLRAMPATIDDQRWSGAASRTIRRMAGRS